MINTNNENVFADFKHAELAKEFEKNGMEIPQPEKITEANFVSRLGLGKDKTDGARSLVDVEVNKVKAADAHAKYREDLAEKLPSFLRKFYLASGSIRQPFVWTIGFPLRFIRSYLYLSYLKLRVLLGLPKDDIHLGNILFCSNPIQSGILALNPGGQVFLPAGTYLISSPLTTVSNLKMVGVGSPSIIKMEDATNHARMIFIGNGQEDIEIRDMTLDSNGTNQGSGANMCIRFEGTTASPINYVKIKDIRFKDVVINGSGSNFGISFSGQASGINYVEISGCRATDWAGNSVIHSIGVKRLLIHDNVWRGPEDAAGSTAPVTIAQNSEFIIYHNNISTHFDNTGSLITVIEQGSTLAIAPKYVVISDNIGFDNYGDQILVEDCVYACVTGNILIGLGGATESGITCSATLSIISNNICEGHGNPGIALFNHSSEATTLYMICTGNVCANNGNDIAAVGDNGIWLDDVKRCIIANNLCIDLQGAGNTQEYGIRSTGTSDENLLMGNITFGNVSGGILLVGSNNVELGNVEFDGSGVEKVRFEVGGTAGRLQLGNFKQLGDIDCDTFGGHQILLPFAFTNVAANTSANMTPFGAPVGHGNYQMEKAGSILGCTYRTTSVLTAGTMEVDIYVEAVDTGFGVSLSSADGVSKTPTAQAKDTDTFTAGQRIVITLVTDAAFAPDGSMDIIVIVRVEI